MALAHEPTLIADEPTTALDVTIQARVLDLLRDLIRKMNTSVLLVTRDLGVVGDLCDRVAMMHAGQMVERPELQNAADGAWGACHLVDARVDR